MQKRSWRRRLASSVSHSLLIAALAAGGVLAFSSTAVAQDAPAAAGQDETIIVTGSRIHTDPLTNRQPVTQLSQEDIARTGLSATADVLQRLPVSGGGLNTRNNNSGNIGNPPDGGGVGAGAAEVDLRFLGARRVLVLVDGQRWVAGTAGSGIPGSVDLNTIPSSMINHIEVLQESASPIYGSDAIAGVVNVITRRHQEGFDAYAQYGGYIENGDGVTQDYGASWGWAGSGAHIVLGANYTKQELVSSADYALSAWPSPYGSSCADGGCSSGAVNGRFVITDPNTLQSLNLTVGNVGATPDYNPLAPHTVAAGNTFRDFTTPDRFNFGPSNYLLTPSERFGAFASWEQDLADDMSFRLRVSYADRHSANQAAPLPLFLGPGAGNGTILDDTVIAADQQYNPFGFELNPGTYSFIGRRLVEAGPRHFEQEVQTWDVAATLEGQWNIFNRDWYWDANATWGQNNASQAFTGDVNVARVQQALGPAAGCVAPCVPLDIFSGGGGITQAMLDFIGYTERNSSESELADFTFNITGNLADLPAGPLAIATGYEHRKVSGSFDPDPITEAGLTSDIPARSGSGSYDVDELYAELRVPILANQPFAYLLEASLAARAFDYSTSGSDSTVSAGLRWRPIEEILIRGSWGQGFRAPSIGELFGGGSRFDATILDPCSDFNGVLGSANDGGRDNPQSAAIINNCITQGVRSDGSFVQNNPQLPVFVTGTASLKPETSESWNIGFVWRPHWLDSTPWSDSVTFEVNYASIRIDDAIQASDPIAILQACAETNACAAVTRAASGDVRGIQDPLTNGGFVETHALDFTINWTSPDWSFGRFSASSNLNHLIDFIDGSNPASPIHREGTERGSPSQGYPDWKAQTTVNWDLHDWGASVTNRYISSLVETANGNSSIDAISYWDVQLRWEPTNIGGGHVQFALGMNNITDEDTPGCFSCDVNNMDPTLYDIPGRFAYARISYRH